MGDAINDIAAERRRQIDTEGWTPEHDDEHADCQMAGAAACYAMSAIPHWAKHEAIRLLWPWSKDWWKQGIWLRNLAEMLGFVVSPSPMAQRLAPPSLPDVSGRKFGEGPMTIRKRWASQPQSVKPDS